MRVALFQKIMISTYYFIWFDAVEMDSASSKVKGFNRVNTSVLYFFLSFLRL